MDSRRRTEGKAEKADGNIEEMERRMMKNKREKCKELTGKIFIHPSIRASTDGWVE